jgi:chromatin remodeling complex protein RSC6
LSPCLFTGKDKETTGKDKDTTGKDKETRGKDKESTGKDKETTGKDKESTGKVSLSIVLSVILRLTASDYLFGIFNFFLY